MELAGSGQSGGLRRGGGWIKRGRVMAARAASWGGGGVGVWRGRAKQAGRRSSAGEGQ
jgi:hypothetical protein